MTRASHLLYSEMVLEETGQQVVDACRRGESDAFRALFERYKDKVYSIALRYSGDPAAAQDIAQETFLKLFANIGGYRGEAAFESWLYRLVVNACFDQRRRTRRFTPLIEGFLDLVRAPSRTALEEVLRGETSAHLRTAVDSLPPGQRMVVILRYTQGLSYEQIAEILDCSAGTIASRLNRIHKLLERRMARLAGSPVGQPVRKKEERHVRNNG